MKHKLASVDGVLLEVRKDWDRYSMCLGQICNGVGPDAWPDPLRRLLDKLPYLLPASKVHDVDYEAGGNDEDRSTADSRFRRNCFRVARAKLGPWWVRFFFRPLGKQEWLLAAGLIEAAYAALRIGGSDAFRNDNRM